MASKDLSSYYGPAAIRKQTAGKSKQDSYTHTHTRTHMRSGTSCREGHVAEKYVTPELNNKINDICPSSWAPFLNSIKFYENAAIKLYMRELAHMC